jgi:hypothetical protein
MEIPTKKPRKSKKHPTPHLSDAHKAANTALSQVRIFIEQAIGGMKRSNIWCRSSAIVKSILRMMPLASVLGCGTSLYLIKEQLYCAWPGGAAPARSAQ